MERSPSILLFGHDQRLVETRQWVLEVEGFHVYTAFDLSEVRKLAKRHEVALFLLCDSLPHEKRAQALALIQATWPGAKRLVLAPARGLSDESSRTEEVFSVTEGPRKLVAMVRLLISGGPTLAV